MAKNTDITIEELDEVQVPLDVMMNNLEACVEKMESSELSLEESFETFKAGMELVKKCNRAIDRVEKEVQLLCDDGSMKDFN